MTDQPSRATVPVDLGLVAETLLIPLYGRAQLARQGERLVPDPWAVELVEAIDYDFARLDGLPRLLGAAGARRCSTTGPTPGWPSIRRAPSSRSASG